MEGTVVSGAVDAAVVIVHSRLVGFRHSLGLLQWRPFAVSPWRMVVVEVVGIGIKHVSPSI